MQSTYLGVGSYVRRQSPRGGKPAVGQIFQRADWTGGWYVSYVYGTDQFGHVVGAMGACLGTELEPISQYEYEAVRDQKWGYV